MTNQPNEIIRKRRQELSLSDLQVAKRAGLSIYEYGDIEQHADEVHTTVHLRDLKKLCEVLGISIFDVLGIAPSVEYSTPRIDLEKIPRNELIRTRRHDMGLSEHQLAEHIGFEDSVVLALEKDPEYLESWAFELIEGLASALDLPVQLLMREERGRSR